MPKGNQKHILKRKINQNHTQVGQAKLVFYKIITMTNVLRALIFKIM